MTDINSESNRKVPESLLAHIWKGQWVQKGALPTSDGRVVRVRSPGIENKDSGPDFLGAVVVLDDEILTGDIELHVKSTDWRAHGHHRDEHFNGVILQVVLWDDAKTPTQLQSGVIIPTLPLHNYLNGSMDELTVRAEERHITLAPCQGIGDQPGNEKLGEVLDQLGEDRFYVKSAFFEVALILEEPSQVLYQGIMGVLGYSKNKQAFQELASHLPLQVLECTIQSCTPGMRVPTLQALFLGAAGLLPSQRNLKYESKNLVELEQIWKTMNTESAMSCSDWHFFRMHPKNFPTQRLLAAGQLFDRYLDGDLLESVLDLTKNTEPGKSATSIENGFIVPDLLGQGRAREIVINVTLPFFFAWAETNSQPKHKQHIMELYRRYPRLGENQITRYLSDLFWSKRNGKIVNSARRQQGLIHLYKTFCQEQRCHACPVSTDSLPD